jgi:dihydroorotase
MDTITIEDPFDAHVHFREGDRLTSVVPFTARQFSYGTIMPNTKTPIHDHQLATLYWEDIQDAIPEGVNFDPLMTLYLTPNLSPDTIRKAASLDIIHGVKLYPKGGTTNSHGGVRRLPDVEEQLRAMEEVGLKLLMHGETADQNIDVFKREAHYYDEAFEWLITNYPGLQIVCEHITTKRAVERVERAPNHVRVAATITPQHLLVNRNDMLGRGGILPHLYCMPILKTADDQNQLVVAATSGNPRFFLGTDTAPHAVGDKECACGCAGVFSAHAALELYAMAFDSIGHGLVERLPDFAGRFGREFYELDPKGRKIILQREDWIPPVSYDFGDAQVVPFNPGLNDDVPLTWKMME